MSGIAGIAAPAGVQREDLERLAEALKHRAPDGIHTWMRPDAGLVRLGDCQTPELVPGPPRTRGDLVLSADVRLDNRAELGAALGLSAAELESLCDEELLLRSFEKYGSDCPRHLLGDFAFAIWDQAARRLFCARDAMGSRPLYYSLGTRGLAFASELKGLLRAGFIDPEGLDPSRIAAHLSGLFLDQVATFYKDARRLPPGHTLSFAGGELEIRPFWSLDPARRCEEPDLASQAETFRHLLREALRCRLRGGQATGLLLSGGLDSSALVSLAHAEGAEGLRCLSATFPAYPAVDERGYVAMALAGTGFEAHYEPVSVHGPLATIDQECVDQDEPFYLPNLYVQTHLARLAQRLGLRVILDGLDGDTCVGHGMEWLGELCRRGRLIRAAKEARALGRRFGHPGWRFLLRFGIVEGPLQSLAHALRRGLGRHLPRRPPSVADRLWQEVGWPAALTGSDVDRGAASSLRVAHYRSLTAPLLTHVFEVHDRAAAAQGIVPRHPYMDRRLVEFCLSLPPEARLAEGWDRLVQRRAMAGRMPDAICWRVHKSHWGEVFQDGLLRRDSARIQAQMSGDWAAEPYLDLDYLRAVWRRCQGGHKLSEDEGMQLWRALGLEIWLASRGKT